MLNSNISNLLNQNKNKNMQTEQQEIPILQQKPEDLDVHPLNVLKILGSQIARYRSTLPKEFKSQSGFARLLIPYRGSPVNRMLVARMEDGDPSVSMGMYMACFDIMKVLPRFTNPFVSELCVGDTGDKHILENIKSSGLSEAIEVAKRKHKA